MFDHVGKGSHSSRASTAASAVSATVAPVVGKQTLAAQAYPPGGAVQRKETSTVGDDTQVHRLAAQGTTAPASPLQHLSTIQRLFGHHDVSAVQAHTGAEATASARTMGAAAYATGNHVVLGTGADLFTEAHEAAHVVQQRGGVQLKGGVGAAGDPYERHADEVATAVVRGESAVAVLDRFAGAGSVAQGQVQKRDEPAGAPTALPGGPGRGPGVDLDNPLGSLGLDPSLAMALGRDWAAIRTWVTTHRGDISNGAAMPSLVTRVRTEVGKQRPSLNTASDETIADSIRDACRSLGIPLLGDAPAPEPASPVVDSVTAALPKIPSAQPSVTYQHGHLQAALTGDVPALVGSGVQVSADTGGATLHAIDRESHSDVTIKATPDLGVTFSTKIGPCTFSAGIDGTHWQIGVAFGPGAPDVQTFPSIFTNAHAALVAAARMIASKPSASPAEIYKTAISPHLDSIKAGISAVKAVADVKPGISIGVGVTGPVGAAPGSGAAAPGPAAMPSVSLNLNYIF